MTTSEQASAPTMITGPASPTPVCWVNGSWTSMSEYGLTVATQGLHYGTGVFEGIRAYWSEQDTCAYIARLPEHVARLLESCRLVRIDLGLTASEIQDVIMELVERNAFSGDLYIRPVAFKSRLGPGTPFGVGLNGVEDLFAVYATPMPRRERLATLRCGVSSWRRTPSDCVPARAKITGSYVNVALAVDEARAAGLDDAILLNTGGTVSEASTTNVFAVSRGVLVTPSLDSDILAGQTRACVLEIAGDLGMTTTERPLTVSELYTADEVFLTGTGHEVVAVGEINGRPIGDGSPGPTTAEIFDTYRSAVLREVAGHHHDWTTKVLLPESPQPSVAPSEGVA
ncbi:aminotransferase class IV [Actinopolyspora sp. H202]|uniref:aminotransferase class IV n=1 Tax=Actinopolyspora sp. H202 TaxID=1500456 RepID=UPI003EE44CC4